MPTGAAIVRVGQRDQGPRLHLPLTPPPCPPPQAGEGYKSDCLPPQAGEG